MKDIITNTPHGDYLIWRAADGTPGIQHLELGKWYFNPVDFEPCGEVWSEPYDSAALAKKAAEEEGQQLAWESEARAAAANKRGPGRPPKGLDRKSQRIEFRCTSDELLAYSEAAFHAHGAEGVLSDWIRDTLNKAAGL